MKKLISALMSLSLLAGVAAMPAAAAETYSMGDVDMNGVVDTVDIVLVLREYVAGMLTDEYYQARRLSDEQRALADVFKNASDEIVVDTADGVTILRYYVYTLVASDPVLPEEFFANEDAYRNEAEQSENIDDAVDQATEELQDDIRESYQNTPGYDSDMIS